MEINKSLDSKIQETYGKTYFLLYADNGDTRRDYLSLGINYETYDALWNFYEGIGEYVGRVLFGRMSITESLKDHISIIEKWESETRQLIDNVEKRGD